MDNDTAKTANINYCIASLAQFTLKLVLLSLICSNSNCKIVRKCDSF